MKEERERKNTKQNLGGRVAVALSTIIAGLAFTSTPSFAQASGAATKTKESLLNLGSDSIVGTSSSTQVAAMGEHENKVAFGIGEEAKPCQRESDCGQNFSRRVVLSSVREEPNADLEIPSAGKKTARSTKTENEYYGWTVLGVKWLVPSLIYATTKSIEAFAVTQILAGPSVHALYGNFSSAGWSLALSSAAVVPIFGNVGREGSSKGLRSVLDGSIVENILVIGAPIALSVLIDTAVLSYRERPSQEIKSTGKSNSKLKPYLRVYDESTSAGFQYRW